jgi:hypothetical protein
MKKKTVFDSTYLADEIITPEKVAHICGVSKRTAQRWIAGHTTPRQAEIELLTLHFRGRIMPKKWPTHWRFDERLATLDIGTHAQGLSWQHIDWYSYSLYCWHRALELITQINARIDEMEKTATSAQIIELNRYRKTLKKLSEHQFHLPVRLTEHLKATYGKPESEYALQDRETHRKTGC